MRRSQHCGLSYSPLALSLFSTVSSGCISQAATSVIFQVWPTGGPGNTLKGRRKEKRKEEKRREEKKARTLLSLPSASGCLSNSWCVCRKASSLSRQVYLAFFFQIIEQTLVTIAPSFVSPRGKGGPYSCKSLRGLVLHCLDSWPLSSPPVNPIPCKTHQYYLWLIFYFLSLYYDSCSSFPRFPQLFRAKDKIQSQIEFPSLLFYAASNVKYLHPIQDKTSKK